MVSRDALNRLFAPSATSASARKSLVQTGLAASVGLLWWVPYGMAFLMQDRGWAAGLNLGTALLAVGCLWAGRRVRTETGATRLAVFALGAWVVSLVGISIATGQSQATGQLYLLTVPLAAAVLVGERGALAWCGVAILGIVLVWLSELVVTTESLPGPGTRLADHVGAILLVALFAVSLRRGGEAELRELEQEREAAREAVAAREHFLATMSHEVRTPLAGVLGTARLMLRESLSDNQRERLRTIHRSGQALMAVLDDALDLSSLREGRVVLAPVPTDVDALLSDVTELFRGKASESGVSLELEGRVGWRHLDPGRLQQVVGNLLGNAVKFTEQGSIRVHAGALDDRLMIDVEDTGPGIEDVTRVFAPFEQGDRVHSRHGGTGLGLAIAEGICRAMGGTLTLQSVLGRGSTFTVVLPAPVTEPVDERSDVRQMVGHEARVLVVEDNPVNVRVCIEMLRVLGYTARTAKDGAEALEQLSREPADLIFMDLNMPGQDGLTVTRRLLELHPTAYVVALTANVRPEDRERCRAAGMRDFVGKPFDLAALAGAVERYGTAVQP